MISNNIISKVAATKRFSGTHLLQEESIADHSVEMALLCINFSELVPESDVKEMCYRCLIHDLEETLTTDVPRTIKYHDPEIKRLIDKAGHEMLTEETDIEFANSASNAKDPEDVNGYLVAIADRIQCFIKMRREVEIYGNKTLKSDFEEFKWTVHDVIHGIKEKSFISDQSKKNLIGYLNKLIIN